MNQCFGNLARSHFKIALKVAYHLGTIEELTHIDSLAEQDSLRQRHAYSAEASFVVHEPYCSF